MNAYQVEAAAELLEAFKRLPQARKITYEARGIVGGDFDVVVTRPSNARPSQDNLRVEVVAR